jgi:NAD(P)-dependent dehydrogenase (short-subunit alcohol dehydrogenase family)
MIAADRGGSIIVTGSTASTRVRANLGAYATSKNGITGLIKTLALELAPYRIRVNSVNPTVVPTKMVLTDRLYQAFRPDLESPKLEDVMDVFKSLHAMDIPWVEAIDVSNAVLWLASDESRFVTGTSLAVDAGSVIS